MTFQPVPFVIGGGAVNPPEVFRLLANIATNGASGVLLPDDLKVQPTAVPGTSVRIGPGSGVIVNTKTGASGETYLARNPDDHLMPITATGAGAGRSDLVWLRIADPQYAGEPAPASVPDGPYVFPVVTQGVANTTKSVADAQAQGLIPAGQVGIALARIDIPASTGTISGGIVDLRKLASPRSLRRLVTAFPSGAESLTASGYGTFPNAASWNIEVPSWASHAIVHAQVVGVKYGTSQAVGDLRVMLGTAVGQATPYDVTSPSGTVRDTVQALDTLSIPTADRGTTAVLKVQGRRTSGAGSLTSNAGATVLVDVEFQERTA